MQKLKKTRRKHTNKQKETEQLKEQHKKRNINTGYPAHEPPRINRTDYSRRFVGWISCISVFCVFLWVCFMFFVCLFLYLFMFSSSWFKLLHLQSKKTYKHIKQHIKHNSKEHIKQHKTQKSLSQTLRDIYFSRRFVGWRSGRGLDILYFCLCFVFLWVCLLFLYVSFCFVVFCFRLVV